MAVLGRVDCDMCLWPLCKRGLPTLRLLASPASTCRAPAQHRRKAELASCVITSSLRLLRRQSIWDCDRYIGRLALKAAGPIVEDRLVTGLGDGALMGEDRG